MLNDYDSNCSINSIDTNDSKTLYITSLFQAGTHKVAASMVELTKYDATWIPNYAIFNETHITGHIPTQSFRFIVENCKNIIDFTYLLLSSFSSGGILSVYLFVSPKWWQNPLSTIRCTSGQIVNSTEKCGNQLIGRGFILKQRQ